jgi:hypothetical protein
MTPTWLRRPVLVVTNERDEFAVRHVQKALGWPETGVMDDAMKSQLRGLQALFQLPMTGILDEATAEQVERIREYGSVEGS